MTVAVIRRLVFNESTEKNVRRSNRVRIKMTLVEVSMKNLRWSSLVGCAIISLLVAGCGSGGGGAQTAPVSTEDPPPGSTMNPPVISGTPQSTVTVGLVYSFIPAAVDPDGDSLTFDIANKPSWAIFDPSTGVLSGQPGANDVGMNAGIVISVSDGANTDSLTAFNVEVLGTATGAVTLSWAAPTLNADDSVLTDHAGYKVYYGMSSGNYPNVKTIDGVGIVSDTVESLDQGTWYFAVTAFDESGNESQFSNEVSKNL
jgi:hypothetical protein